MPDVAAAVKAWLGALALSWTAAASGQPAGTQAAAVAQGVHALSKPPAIVLSNQQSSLAGTCGGSAFDVNTIINVEPAASADVQVTAPSVGLIEEFTDNTGNNLGSFRGRFPNFHIKPFGGGLPPNTPITITITTYTDANLTGSVNWVSSLTFDCTTGRVLRAPARNVSGVPSLSPVALAATAGLLVVFGAISLRRAKRAR